MKEIRLKESLVQQPAALRHDPAKGLVFGVKLVSFGESSNKRIYDKSCAADVNKYHGVKVNIDHQENPESAPFRSRFGRISNPTIGSDGLYGTLKYNPKHQFAEQFKWFVDNDPTAIGLSHNAVGKLGRMEHGKMVVTGFAKVDSVDIVGDPASTHGLFESKGQQEPAAPEVDDDVENQTNFGEETPDEEPSLFDEALAKLAEAAVLEAAKLDCAECARKVRAIADLLDDMEGGESLEEGTSETTGEQKPQESEEEQMKESKDQNEKVDALEKLVATLQAELTEIRVRESKAVEYSKRKLAMKQRCIEAKLDENIVSETFIDTLASQVEDDVILRLIEDRREFAVPKKVESETIVSGGKDIRPLDKVAAKKALLGV